MPSCTPLTFGIAQGRAFEHGGISPIDMTLVTRLHGICARDDHLAYLFTEVFEVNLLDFVCSDWP